MFPDRSGKNFVLHAPRQTGKTTCLPALMKYLNNNGKYCCLYMNVESAQSAKENVGRSVKAILNELGSLARVFLGNDVPDDIWPNVLERSGEDAVFCGILRPDGCIDMDKPIVSFQEFFREHSGHWVERFNYLEVGPQILLQAFLQRIQFRRPN